jgi:hypothetical protein
MSFHRDAKLGLAGRYSLLIAIERRRSIREAARRHGAGEGERHTRMRQSSSYALIPILRAALLVTSITFWSLSVRPTAASAKRPTTAST